MLRNLTNITMYSCQKSCIWKYQVIQFLCLLLCHPTFIATSNCGRYLQETCSIDCIWNTMESKCEDCEVGYYGTNCSLPCRYPNYGEDCQQNCSHCSKELCNSTFGCPTTDTGIKLEKETSNSDKFLAIGIPLGGGIVSVIAVFIVITVANRRFFTGHMRQNALYLGSVVAEHCVTTTYIHVQRPDQRNSCTNSNSDIYSVVNSLQRQNEPPQP